jgi:hypothetical protein
MIVVILVTPKAAAKHELLFNKACRSSVIHKLLANCYWADLHFQIFIDFKG